MLWDPARLLFSHVAPTSYTGVVDVPRPLDPFAPRKAPMLVDRLLSTVWPNQVGGSAAARGQVRLLSPAAADTKALVWDLPLTRSRGRSAGRRRQRQQDIDELKQAYSRGFTALLTSANVSAKTYTLSGIWRWYSVQMWMRWTVKYGVQQAMKDNTMHKVIWSVRTRARDIAATLNAARRSRGDVIEDLLDLFPVPMENSSSSIDSNRVDTSVARLFPVSDQWKERRPRDLLGCVKDLFPVSVEIWSASGERNWSAISVTRSFSFVTRRNRHKRRLPTSECDLNGKLTVGRCPLPLSLAWTQRHIY